MFHPVGSQPPSVYWRRRLMLVGAVVLALVLILLTVKAISGGGGGNSASSKPPAPSTSHSSTAGTSTKPKPTSSQPSSTAGTTGHAPSANSASTASTPCKSTDLQVAAVVGKSSYTTSEDPLLELQVINAGTTPCTQDMADKQIELSVYNGSSRVWGSHDCAVKSGTDVRTLAVGQPYRSAILWTGLTSDTSCKETRQRVGAGSYTLYAKLSGHLGKAAQFTIG